MTWKEIVDGYGLEEVPKIWRKHLKCCMCGVDNPRDKLYTTEPLVHDSSGEGVRRMVNNLVDKCFCKHHAFQYYGESKMNDSIDKAVDKILSEQEYSDYEDEDEDGEDTDEEDDFSYDDESESKSSTEDAIELLKEALNLVQEAAETVDEAKLKVKEFGDEIGGDIMGVLDDDIANVLAIGKDSVKARIQNVIDQIHEFDEKKKGFS